MTEQSSIKDRAADEQRIEEDLARLRAAAALLGTMKAALNAQDAQLVKELMDARKRNSNLRVGYG